MESKLVPFLFKRTLSVISLFMVMFLFQNCGMSEENIDAALSDYESQRADKLPFAFDLSVDQIAYMSCEGDGLQTSTTFFNFKAGAYNADEGIKFKESFFDSSEVGSLGGNKEKLLSYLAGSKRNQGAGVVMSLRKSDGFSSPFGYNGDPTKYVSPMLWNLASNIQLAEKTIAGMLYDNPGGINYLSGLSGTRNKTFDATLGFESVGGQNSLVRPLLEGDGYLAFTFATTDLKEPGFRARSPIDSSGVDPGARNSVFGKGYKMGFAQEDVGRPNSPRVVVTSVTGYNMENDGTSLGEGWVCPPDERYIIMKDAADAMRRFDDAPLLKNGVPNEPWNVDDVGTPLVDESYDDGGVNVGGYYMDYAGLDILSATPTTPVKMSNKVLCPMVPDDMLSGQAEHTNPAWKRVRNILSADEWFVFRGPRYNCVVPKKGDGASACYGKVAKAGSGAQVQYFYNEDFVDRKIQDEKDHRDAGGPPHLKPIRPLITDCEGPGSGNSLCPQVLSICYKTN